MNKIKMTLSRLCFLILLILMGNYIGYGVSPLSAAPGILILSLISLVGLALFEHLKIRAVPAVVYISLLSIVVSAPWWPVGKYIVYFVEKVDILTLATPVLACAGLSIGSEFRHIKKQGLRMLIVSISVFTGTFICSACIAECVIRLTNGR